MKALFAGIVVCAALAVLLVGGTAGGQDKEKPKYTISEVMKKSMNKGGLFHKFASGSATPEEKEQLIELFEALHQNAPPKGPEDDWKMKTKALLEAAKTAKSDDSKIAALKNLANCKACHTVHKGK